MSVSISPGVTAFTVARLRVELAAALRANAASRASVFGELQEPGFEAV